ncbi:MAG: M1 family metallopeptidase [Raineya sp.]
MLKKLCLAYCCFYLSFLAQSQISVKDSLLGTLSAARTCFDVKHYDLHLQVNPTTQSIKGSNTITYQLQSHTQLLQIDLDPTLTITQIKQGEKKLQFKRQERAVFIKLPKVQKKNSVHSIEIHYEGKPLVGKNPPWNGGFVWKEDASGKPWIGVACQGIGASVWYPCKDHWSDKPDSVRLQYDVPKGLMAVGNGNLVKKEALEEWDRYLWKTSYPINNYNVTLNVGNYQHFSDEYTSQDGQKLALDYYVLPENLEKAKKHFEQEVKRMLACYEKLFGKYPFWNDGYALVETPYLGMEHQGAIAYGNKYKMGYNGSDLTGTGIQKIFDFIIVHETGHEYWGNSISGYDKSDMWIHEAFCTYGEALYVECLQGKEKAFAYTNGWKRIVANDTPIIPQPFSNQEGSGDMYFKGALMLHTLRNILNDDAKWFKIIYDFAQDFKGKITKTDEVLSYFEQKMQRKVKPIFEQYLKHTSLPTFEYKVENNTLKYRWIADTKDFAMPIVLEIAGNPTRLEARTEWQHLPLASKPESVSIRTDLFFIQIKK